MSDREKLLNLTREATAKIANHCANTSCEKCAKESGKYDKESGKCKCSTMEMFTDHLIANGVTVQKWIPVSERLPEVPVGYVQIQVIIFCESGVELAWFQIDTEEFYDINGWLGTSVSGVTHWMPIPRPPKGE